MNENNNEKELTYEDYEKLIELLEQIDSEQKVFTKTKSTIEEVCSDLPKAK